MRYEIKPCSNTLISSLLPGDIFQLPHNRNSVNYMLVKLFPSTKLMEHTIVQKYVYVDLVNADVFSCVGDLPIIYMGKFREIDD